MGETNGNTPSLMLNLLGEENYQGPPIYVGIDKILGLSGVHLYLYGKESTKPYRKMGHLCITANTIEECKNIAETVKEEFKIIS